MDLHNTSRLGQSSRDNPPPALPGTESSTRTYRTPQPLPHRFSHIQDVYDEKAKLSHLQAPSKHPAGLDLKQMAGPSSISRSQVPSPVSSIPPWLRSQSSQQQPRLAPPHPPFSPAPCPIASSWASPSGPYLSASTSYPSSYYYPAVSPYYTRPRGLRIYNLIKPWIPILVYIITTLSFFVAVSFWKEEVFQALDELSRWLESDTYLGYAVIFALIFLTTIPPIPLYSTLIVLAGYTYGPMTGTIISYFASLTGALVVFTVSRTFFRASISRWLSCTSWIKRVVRAIENNPKLLFLIRLAPYPYNVMNCLLAASPSLTLRTYLFCTALSLPKLIIHTSIGSSIHSFAEYHVKRPGQADSGEDDSGTLSYYSTIAGIALCFAIFVYLSYITRKAVDEELQDEDAMEAAYSEERVAFLASQDGDGLDLEEQMAEVPRSLETRQIPTRGGSPTPVSFAAWETSAAAAAVREHAAHGPGGADAGSSVSSLPSDI